MSLLAQRVVTAVVLASVAVVLILRFDNGVFAAFIGAFIVLAAREWADELGKLKRPDPVDPKLAKAYKQSLQLPALTGIADIINRHTVIQKELNELLDELPK